MFDYAPELGAQWNFIYHEKEQISSQRRLEALPVPEQEGLGGYESQVQ